MKYRAVLFDLDGTITESGTGITRSAAYALRKMGREVPSVQTLERFVGPPLWESFRKFCGLSREESEQAVSLYREYYRETGIFENRVYDGFEDVLKRLSAAGRTLLVATSKPEVFARRILEHFGLSRYFAFIGGSELSGERVDKAEVIAYSLAGAGVSGGSSAVMVGDRKHDILGAKKVGAASLGVLYGYGSRDELAAAGADFIAETVPEVGDILLEK